jgi:hypothetical protein
MQLVALHIQDTPLDGYVPCSWVEGSSLQSLVLSGNINLRGPLPLCFVKMHEPGLNVLIQNNSEAEPFCGSGESGHPIAPQLPKCSNIPNIVTV